MAPKKMGVHRTKEEGTEQKIRTHRYSDVYHERQTSDDDGRKVTEE